LALCFVSSELTVVGVLDGVAKLRWCQVVLPFLRSGETATVFAGDRWVSFLFPQIISSVCVLVGVGSVRSFCFVSAKGCELPLIPSGRWISAIEVLPGGGGCSWRALGEEDADALQRFTCGSTVGLGRWLLRLYM